MKVSDLEIYDLSSLTIGSATVKEESLGYINEISPIENGKRYSGRKLECLFKLIMRECLWCRLKGNHNSYIHFGYDYYTYWGSNIDIDYDFIRELGLYAEIWESPYRRLR